MPVKTKSKVRANGNGRHRSNGHKAADLAAVKASSETRTGIRFFEAGTSGLREFYGFVQEAYNTALTWPSVQPLYSRLRRSMPEMVMIRTAFTSWARNIRPIVDLPDNPSEDDKKYQTFLESEFENWEGGFTKLVDTMVNYVPFMGWGWWEVVPAIRDPNWKPPAPQDKNGKAYPDSWRSEADDGLIGIRRFGWRDSATFNGWDMDDRKNLRGMKQLDFPNQEITLPLDDVQSGQSSLHLTFGDPNNPEGLSPLEAVWRLERLRFGYEVVMGIGSEHAAGHLKVRKTEQGVLSNTDKTDIAEAAKNLLSAQEGNYGYFPFGLDGEVMDVPFQAASSLLETIKHYSIAALSVYMMQFVALNTMTSTGAQASQVDSTDTAVFTFNSMMDGFASQFDEQIGKRLYRWNKDAFPGLTKRPRIKFSHIDKTIALGELASFLSTMDGILVLGDDDIKAIRKRSGFLPENNPAGVDLKRAQEARRLDQKARAGSDAGTVEPEEGKKKAEAGKDKTLSEFDFPGHEGRPGKVGGSLPRGEGGGVFIPVSKVHPTGRTVMNKFKNGPRAKTSDEDVGVTGHGFRWMGEAEFKKFATGKLKYGGTAENEHEKGIMFANAPGDFFYAGGKKRIWLVEVDVQGNGGGLDAPKGSVGLEHVVGAWMYNPDTGMLEVVIKRDDDV